MTRAPVTHGPATGGGAGGGTWRAPRAGVRHFPNSLRVLAAGAAAACLALAAAAAPAAAQIAGVPTAPRVRRAPAVETSPDSATRAERTSAKTVEQERQRLDIQAWVDSAAGALARSAPAPIPAPGSGGRPSIFAQPAVPDSLRPPAAQPASTPARATRPRRRARP